MLPHDEVRERPARLWLPDEPQPHPDAAGSSLDADDLDGEPERRLAGQVEVQLRRRSLAHRVGSPQKQPTPGDILDQSVNDNAVAPALRSDLDGDSNRFPFVHVRPT